jgi:hypothetical protein
MGLESLGAPANFGTFPRDDDQVVAKRPTDVLSTPTPAHVPVHVHMESAIRGDAFLPDGSPSGTAEAVLDLAAGLYLPAAAELAATPTRVGPSADVWALAKDVMRRRRPVRMFALAVAAGAVVSGCSPASAGTTARPWLTGRYVAIGSSIAAGPGLGPDVGQGCLRSAENYAHLVATALRLDLVDVTCSGATTANVLTKPQLGHPPQITAVTPDTRLVTVTVGGNDVRYGSDIQQCMDATEAGQPCTPQTPAQTAQRMAVLRGQLDGVVRAVVAVAPHAVVLLVTYPRIFPAPPSSCGDNVLSATESGALAAVGSALETTFLTVAKDTGIRVVDAYAASAGHDVCAAPEQRWINGSSHNGVNYHPTATGMTAVARLVEATLAATAPR